MTLRIVLNDPGDEEFSRPSAFSVPANEPFRLGLWIPPTPEELIELEKARPDIRLLVSELPEEIKDAATKLMAALKSPAEKEKCSSKTKHFIETCNKYEGVMDKFYSNIEKDFGAYKAALIEIWNIAICQSSAIGQFWSLAGKWKANRISEDSFDCFGSLAESKRKCQDILSEQSLHLGPFNCALITANLPGCGVSLNTRF